jgi:cobalt-zinc-cadmium efflux system membrane fusion protein
MPAFRSPHAWFGARLAVMTLRAACALPPAFGLASRAYAADADRPAPSQPATTVTLTDSQRQAIGIGVVGTRAFPRNAEMEASVDFNEDAEVQAFPSYQGKILSIAVHAGDRVAKGQELYSIESADLIEAESTLIAADGVMRLTTNALDRATALYHTHSLAQKDYDQAVSDQQTADGNLHAARDSVRVFGKTDEQIDRIARSRRIDPALVVNSPVAGIIVSRAGAPGSFVQPGNAPAPVVVADDRTMWLLGAAPEFLSASLHRGQAVQASIPSLPNQRFIGDITMVGSVVDATTRRITLRAEIADPAHSLRSGMFATMTIRLAPPVLSVALPENGVVREGDGTYTAWVTTDQHHFTQRIISIGGTDNGFREITAGLRAGETAVTNGAVFLSNMLTAEPSD